MSIKPECPLDVKVNLKTHIKKIFIENVIICARNLMQCAYKCTELKLLNGSIISWGGIGLIQFFSHNWRVFTRLWVSTRLVQYLQISLAPKSGPLNLRSAKCRCIKLRRYCIFKIIQILQLKQELLYSNLLYWSKP
jgi:hypothetical protein